METGEEHSVRLESANCYLQGPRLGPRARSRRAKWTAVIEEHAFHESNGHAAKVGKRLAAPVAPHQGKRPAAVWGELWGIRRRGHPKGAPTAASMIIQIVDRFYLPKQMSKPPGGPERTTRGGIVPPASEHDSVRVQSVGIGCGRRYHEGRKGRAGTADCRLFMSRQRASTNRLRKSCEPGDLPA